MNIVIFLSVLASAILGGIAVAGGKYVTGRCDTFLSRFGFVVWWTMFFTLLFGIGVLTQSCII